jgi:hypothetical protein
VAKKALHDGRALALREARPGYEDPHAVPGDSFIVSEKGKNLAASVRQRLANVGERAGADFQQILSAYAIERFLHRLSVSRHRKDFVLKGTARSSKRSGQRVGLGSDCARSQGSSRLVEDLKPTLIESRILPFVP